jgi:histidinol-phosphate/aromatic aminotransferase/cobyric acid decarboxylase-like protein
MQQYELEAWLGDDHGLTDDQLDELLAQATEIQERYPDPDDQAERDAALTAAYRLKVEPPENVLSDYSAQRTAARAAEAVASAGLQQAAQSLIWNGQWTEAGFARAVGVDRMTVRKWTQDQKDRALFNEAIFALVRIGGMPAEDQQKLNDALGIRDTSGQAGVLLAGLTTCDTEQLSPEQRALVDRAAKRARQLV